MTSVSGCRLVCYVSGIKSLLHRVATTRISTTASTTVCNKVTSAVWSRGHTPSVNHTPLVNHTLHLDPLSLTTMDHHLQALTAAPPTDCCTPAQDLGGLSPFDPECVECAVQNCPQRLISDVRLMFPDAPPSPVTVVTVAQRTLQDMSRWDAQVLQEREALLEAFVQGAIDVCEKLRERGFWADFIDPSSGLPFLGPYTNMTLFETDDRYSSLGFCVEDLGCCRVLRHTLWGTHVFVGTIFTDAPGTVFTAAPLQDRSTVEPESMSCEGPEHSVVL